MVWKRPKHDMKKRISFKVFLAEALGMTIAVFIGIASNAQVISGYYLRESETLPWSFGDMSTAAIGNGLGVAIGLSACSSVCGYHLNPALTVAQALCGRCRWRLVPIYLFAQLAGALIASIVAYSVHVDGIDRFDQRSPFKSDVSFASYPVKAENASLGTLIADQMWATSIFAIFHFAFADERGVLMKSGHQLFPALAIGSAYTLAMLTSSINSGASLNPTRDFCARLSTLIAQYGTDVFTKNGNFWWIPFVTPFCGAIIGGVLYQGIISFLRPELKPPGPSSTEIKLRELDNLVQEIKTELRDQQPEEEEPYKDVGMNTSRYYML